MLNRSTIKYVWYFHCIKEFPIGRHKDNAKIEAIQLNILNGTAIKKHERKQSKKVF